ncbi:amino acid synthesis family protein [Microbacterium sp. MEC084]|uniref:amino acid synthesis family protein n=1 Tax=Microbacterium sp. MEC084 TaxID=1963027 RepID=UPI00106FD5A0|nr:amino acid synthesis family protein [Microbacterium sp. MEC084]MCD1269942.1 amino acid synthesis family protein [Microbacterium sp. MEC084]
MSAAVDLVHAAYQVRGWYDVVQEVEHERGPAPARTLIKAASAVVIANPFAGRWEPELSPLVEPSAALGTALGERARRLLGGRPVEGYGKGGIAGLAGEQEHVVACITTVFGDAFRAEVGGGSAWISSASKTAAAGTPLDIPLAYKDEVYVRSHYDAITIAAPDGPRPDELLICVAVSTGGRVHARVGGLTVADVVGQTTSAG